MQGNNGWFLIWRKLFDRHGSWLIKLRDAEAIVFLVYLISKARWCDGLAVAGWREIEVKRGQLWTSIESLRRDYSEMRGKVLTYQQVIHMITRGKGQAKGKRRASQGQTEGKPYI